VGQGAAIHFDQLSPIRHFLLFGTDGQGRPHIGEFAADPHGIRYRSETEEEEAFDDWLLRREQDFDH
jgi:hypothetical protein